MSEPGAAIARFDFTNGGTRGTHLILYANCVVHRGEGHAETVPLAAVAAARVAFERDTRKLGWAGGLFVAALVLFALSGPLAAFASGAAAEMASTNGQGVARALQAMFRLLEAIANFLPVAGFAGLVGAVAVGALGWLGTTTLKLDLAGAERAYAVRGHDTKLVDFAEALAEKLILVKR
ncbi:MAG TPA: hypothetical protein VD965_04760 [Burkholderiales bacterium]|nr:hypothetical protein [Burkholderiales bacterium]